MKLIVAVLLLCSLTYSTAQPLKRGDKMKNFKKVDPKNYSDKDLNRLNHSSDYTVHVEFINNQLVTTKAEPKSQVTLDVEDGTFVGIDRGEWGGELYFQKKGSDEKIDLKHGQIQAIFEDQNKIYVLDGIAHMGFSRGSLGQITRQNDNFTYNRLVAFDDAPYTYAPLGDSLLFAAFESFYIVHNNKVTTFIDKAFWWGLYPCSIAVENKNNIYIGMRGGYAKINLEDKNDLFFYEYIPDDPKRHF